MSYRTFLLVFVVAALLVVLLVLWPGQPKKNESAGIASETPVAYTSDIVVSTTLSPTELLSIPPPPTAIPAPTPPPAGVLAVRLVDALGDPIPNGAIEIASKTYESATSEFLIRDVSAGTYSLSARADGYQAATQTIEVPTDRAIAITLEYFCTFEITVKDGNGTPASGAEVSLMGGPKPPRPPKSLLSVVAERDLARNGNLNLRPVDGKISVNSIEGIQPSGHWLEERSDDHEIGDPHLEANDIVVGVHVWSEEQLSPLSRLRKWDTIALLISNSDRASSSIGSLRFQRGSRLFQCPIFGIQETCGLQTILTSFTDEMGKCRFDNLPPAFYSVKAAKGTARTTAYPLCPVDSSLNVRLCREEENIVSVSVEKENFPYIRWRYIPNAEVRLEGMDRKILMSGNTGPGGGSIRFQPVPWGRYRVTVVPPESLQTEPASKEIEISVEDPATRVTAEFRVTGDTATVGVKISGIVQREDTKETLADFPIELRINRAGGHPGRPTIWRQYALTTTNATGEFEFEQVLPGSYMITSLTAKEFPSVYTHCGKGLRFLDREDPRAKPEPHFEVTTNDITGIVYSVLPATITTLMGTVTMADGSPVADARLEIEGLDERFIQSDNQTDKEGRFIFSFLLPVSEKPVETALRAVLKAEPIARMRFDPEGNPEYSYEDAGLTADGSAPITFRVGDTIRNIRIVLKVMEKGYVLYGKILTEDGGTPEYPEAIHLDISQKQENPVHKESVVRSDQIRLKARVEPDGTYRIEGLQPGPFRLIVSPCDQFPITPEKITLPSPVSYQGMEVQLEMPPDVKEMRYDVILKKNSYVHGRVLDENLRLHPSPLAGQNLG